MNYAEFEKRCEQLKLSLRVFSRGEWEAINAPKEKAPHNPAPTKLIEEANRSLFKKYCEREGIDPDKTAASPVLRRIINEQDDARAAIDADEKT